MGRLDSLKMGIGKVAGRSGLKLKKYSPEILLGAGIVGIVASTVMICKASLKADSVIEKHNKKLESIKGAKEISDTTEGGGDYSEQEYNRDINVTYVQTFVDFIKLYGPAATLGVASIACILGSHGIMKKRNIAIMAAYKAVEKSFADYRKRVMEEYGPEKDYALKHGIRKIDPVEIETVNENGETDKITVDTVVDPSGISQYARFYDDGCREWSKNPEYNLTFLLCQQNYANQLLNSRGHVFLNEVYDMLGIPRTQAGCVVGWVKGNGDNFIDFGIHNQDSVKARDFVNGYERTILLDFNVDGVIYGMI
jgi:hypothetical protein